MADVKCVVGPGGTQTLVPFTQADIDQQTLDKQASDAKASAYTVEKTRTDTFRADATRVDLLSRLSTATAAQIRTFVNNQVTDLPSARTMLANILILLALDARS